MTTTQKRSPSDLRTSEDLKRSLKGAERRKAPPLQDHVNAFFSVDEVRQKVCDDDL